MSKVLICGFENAGADILFSTLKCCTSNAGFVDGNISILDLYGDRHEHIVSHSASDLFSFRKLLKTAPALQNDFRVIFVIRDPRYLLTRLLDDGLNYFQGFDHAFNITDTGFLSFSNPGVLATEQIIWKSTRKLPFTMALRCEELLQNPEPALAKVARFAGLTLNLEKLPQHVRRGGLPFGNGQESDASLWDRHASRIVRQFRLAPALFDLLSRWQYDSDTAWYHGLVQRAADAFDDSPGTVFAYFTRDSRYEAEVRRLEASLQRLQLPLALQPVSDAGSWLANVRQKPSILLDVRKRTRGPLLYVDADAVVHSNPWPYLRSYTGDVAISTHHGTNVISGTILLNDTDGARRFLKLWIEEQSANPEAWDQHSLHNVVERNRQQAYAARIRVQYLPPEMCRVFDRTYRYPLEVVVEHLQASREMRAIGGTEQDVARARRRRERATEIEMQLARVGCEGGGELEKAAVSASSPKFHLISARSRGAQTEAHLATRESDIVRWSDSENLKSDWASRAALAAKLVGDARTLIDLGCGKMELEKHIAPQLKYIPLDLVPRDDRTVVCDLNRDELPDVSADLATMLGVLEYIHDPDALLRKIASRWPGLIVSYNPADVDCGRDRKSHGWFNDLTSATLVSIAGDAGFGLEAMVPFAPYQRIYRFSRAS